MAAPARRSPLDTILSSGPMTLLAPGTVAPDFTARASDGQSYRLRDLLQRSRVLLVFYPGNNTPG
jgi:peroxiredoxin